MIVKLGRQQAHVEHIVKEGEAYFLKVEYLTHLEGVAQIANSNDYKASASNGRAAQFYVPQVVWWSDKADWETDRGRKRVAHHEVGVCFTSLLQLQAYVPEAG